MGLIGRFGPPLALMALIFFLSAQEGLNSGLGVIDAVGRKGVHMAEFGGLWWLWWRAFEWRRLGLSITIALAYAASDEIHQTYVAGRSGTVWDFAIDAAGVGVAGLLTVWLARRRRERA